MDSLLNRYRNVTVLVLAIFAQLVLLAYQVKTGNDVRLIRVWAVKPSCRSRARSKAFAAGLRDSWAVI